MRIEGLVRAQGAQRLSHGPSIVVAGERGPVPPLPTSRMTCRPWPAPIDLGEIRNAISPLRQWIVTRQGQDRVRAWGA